MTVPVVWFTSEPGSQAHCCWDQAIVSDLLTGRLCPPAVPPGGFTEIGRPPADGAVVVVPARMEHGDAAAVQALIDPLRWVLLLLTSDEEGTFPWRDVTHPRMRVWVQAPNPGVHHGADGFLPIGYRPDTAETLDLLAVSRPLGPVGRDIDVSFAGQVTHGRRIACRGALRRCEEAGRVVSLTETTAFAAGIDYRDYMAILARSRLVACPGGPQTPDTFRVWEALEAGCVPLVDAHAGERHADGYWDLLFGDNPPPWPVVDAWADAPAIIDGILGGGMDLPILAARCSAWWRRVKHDLAWKLHGTLDELARP